MDGIHELIEKRWSPRAFDEKKVEQEKLKRVFEAARRSPSASNEQPWRFLLGIKGEDEAYSKLYDCLNEFNQKWAKHAPVVSVIVAKLMTSKSGNPNPHAIYDCGQAAAYLTMQATSEGLFVHQMGGFFPEKVKTLFQIPEGYEPVTAFVIGYLGNPAILSEDHKKMEYKKVVRKELEEIVFEAWDKAAKL